MTTLRPGLRVIFVAQDRHLLRVPLTGRNGVVRLIGAAPHPYEALVYVEFDRDPSGWWGWWCEPSQLAVA